MPVPLVHTCEDNKLSLEELQEANHKAWSRVSVNRIGSMGQVWC